MGKIRICSPLETRAKTQAMVGIVRTGEILANAGLTARRLPNRALPFRRAVRVAIGRNDTRILTLQGIEGIAIGHNLLFASRSMRRYNRLMDTIIQVLGPMLEWMFFLGMAGSALVVVISFIEDFYTIFEED